MGPMIQIRHLRKEYKGLVAVKDLSLDLDAGDIFGFIGPNGAGKTTTIKMLATLLTPTSGVALVITSGGLGPTADDLTAQVPAARDKVPGK